MPKLSVKAVIEGARERMNSSGRHWTKGSLAKVVQVREKYDYSTMEYVKVRKAVPTEVSNEAKGTMFCSIGGIERTLWEIYGGSANVDGVVFESEEAKELRTKAVMRVAKAIIAERPHLIRHKDEIEEFEKDPSRENAEAVIVSFNDNRRTTWKDVEHVFRVAEKLRS